MKYYAIAEIDITDPSWVRDYVANVTAIVERQGGRYLARTGKIEHIEQRVLPRRWRGRQRRGPHRALSPPSRYSNRPVSFAN